MEDHEYIPATDNPATSIQFVLVAALVLTPRLDSGILFLFQ